MRIDNQTGDFIVFVGNDGLMQELFQRHVGQRDPRRDHLRRAIGCDPRQAVAGAWWRGLGQQIAQIIENIGGHRWRGDRPWWRLRAISASLRDVQRKDYQLMVLAQQASGWCMVTGERRYNDTTLARYSELVPGLVFYTLKFRMVLGGRPY